MPHKIQKTCTVRGVDYLLSLAVDETARDKREIIALDKREMFVVHALNQLTQFCWRGSFDADTVARLTTQAGSLKAFASFTAMLKAAILRTSKSVCLNLITPDTPVEAVPPRLYMILTLRTEFEECNYPLPLDLREQRSRSRHNQGIRDHGEPESLRMPQDFDTHKIAFVEFQIEVKHLRKENHKLREALIEERSNKKEFEFRLCREKEDYERDVESQLSNERTQFQKELHHASRQAVLLSKNLNLAQREVDSLRIQVRRLQAENAGYKRSLTTRPAVTTSKSRASLPKHSRSSLVESKGRVDTILSRERVSRNAKYPEGRMPGERSVSPSYRRQNRIVQEPRSYQTAMAGKPSGSGLQRYHSADFLHQLPSPSPILDPYHLQRSRSYSPAHLPRRPAFSTIKTLCPSESLVSGSRCNTPNPRPSGFVRDSRYSRREPRRPPGSTVSSLFAESPRGSVRHARQYRSERSTSPPSRLRMSPSNQRYVATASPMRVRRGSQAAPSRFFCENEETVLKRGVKIDYGPSNWYNSRSASPAELLAQRYKDGATGNQPSTSPVPRPASPDAKRRTSLNGAKFRDLLARLQGLGDEFPDSPRGIEKES
ncbi:hypothetical protein BV898_15251 [Hypsibius exemplaris]|uniref:Coiled-coil domain-containing protein 61 n=1 Tax=Hypsibius exemplaris TaxID=2072580 RepID=A0A9X6NAB2_HYPEX|nr:hypothetical protein BV898_15251 [Hypsibius exemplaris]